MVNLLDGITVTEMLVATSLVLGVLLSSFAFYDRIVKKRELRDKSVDSTFDALEGRLSALEIEVTAMKQSFDMRMSAYEQEQIDRRKLDQIFLESFLAMFSDVASERESVKNKIQRYLLEK